MRKLRLRSRSPNNYVVQKPQLKAESRLSDSICWLRGRILGRSARGASQILAKYCCISTTGLCGEVTEVVIMLLWSTLERWAMPMSQEPPTAREVGKAFGEHPVDPSYKYKYIYMSSVIRRGSGY